MARKPMFGEERKVTLPSGTEVFVRPNLGSHPMSELREALGGDDAIVPDNIMREFLEAEGDKGEVHYLFFPKESGVLGNPMAMAIFATWASWEDEPYWACNEVLISSPGGWHQNRQVVSLRSATR